MVRYYEVTILASVAVDDADLKPIMRKEKLSRIEAARAAIRSDLRGSFTELAGEFLDVEVHES